MRHVKSFAVVITALVALFAQSCNKGPEENPVVKPSITISEPQLNDETMSVTVTISPSADATAWYYSVAEGDAEAEYTCIEGAMAKQVMFDVVSGVEYTISAYAENKAGVSDVATKSYFLEPDEPTIAVSEPMFDEATMTVSFDVTPSQDTHHWYWGIKSDSTSPSDYEQHEGSEAKRVSCGVEYDKKYTFLFRAENVVLKGQEREVEFSVISPVVNITIANLTAFTVDAVIEKREHCVRYVAGAVHASAYDRDTFIEQAQSSLNPDSSYPFMVFNTATESRTFSEQDLVRNSLSSSDVNAGLILVPGMEYIVAVYGENSDGGYNVSTINFTAPQAELNGTMGLDIELEDITETSASATVTADGACKVLVGFVDPALAKTDAENPFDFEGKSDEEIKRYIISVANGVPAPYSAPITTLLSDRFAIDAEYVAYAIAISNGKVGDVAFEVFKTKRPSLTGEAHITAAEIEPQTEHETLCVKLTTDDKATKVRLYAAPSSDHEAYKNTLDYVMDADDYQNYREEYEVVNGLTTCVVEIYHPGDNYYLYASAVDNNGKAGDMVCVATMAGLDTEYYTTIEEIIDDGNVNFKGTATVDMVVTVISDNDDRISVSITTDTRSSNAEKVWLMRMNDKIENIESIVKSNFAEYPDHIYGSYKVAELGTPCEYKDWGSSFDPKIESLLKYDNSWGGDIVVAIVLDSSGKLNIHSYYAAGRSVVVM